MEVFYALHVSASGQPANGTQGTRKIGHFYAFWLQSKTQRERKKISDSFDHLWGELGPLVVSITWYFCPKTASMLCSIHRRSARFLDTAFRLLSALLRTLVKPIPGVTAFHGCPHTPVVARCIEMLG